MHATVAAALPLVFVPSFEGFGIPVAEAMTCGVPVLAADATSLPEVAGDAAIYCDPFKVESIAEAMARLWDDPPLCAKLAEAGLERAQRYTWGRTGEGLWQSRETVLKLG